VADVSGAGSGFGQRLVGNPRVENSRASSAWTRHEERQSIGPELRADTAARRNSRASLLLPGLVGRGDGELFDFIRR